MIKTISDGIRLDIYVQPGASKTQVVGMHDQSLKVKIKAPPVDGKANQAVVEFFAKFFAVKKSAVSVVSGDKSRHKVLEISGVKAEIAALRLAPFMPE